jgi:hypothetical protein
VLEGVHQVVDGQHQFAARLANIFARADGPALMNFIALVKWIDPEAAAKLTKDIGMTA